MRAVYFADCHSLVYVSSFFTHTLLSCSFIRYFRICAAVWGFMGINSVRTYTLAGLCLGLI